MTVQKTDGDFLAEFFPHCIASIIGQVTHFLDFLAASVDDWNSGERERLEWSGQKGDRHQGQYESLHV